MHAGQTNYDGGGTHLPQPVAPLNAGISVHCSADEHLVKEGDRFHASSDGDAETTWSGAVQGIIRRAGGGPGGTYDLLRQDKDRVSFHAVEWRSHFRVGISVAAAALVVQLFASLEIDIMPSTKQVPHLKSSNRRYLGKFITHSLACTWLCC